MEKLIQLARHLTNEISRPLRDGGNPVSRWLRMKLESMNIRQYIGINLAGIAFFSAIIVPGARDIFSNIETSIIKPEQPVIDIIPTASTFQWPLARFSLTQQFSIFHPGLDLASSSGTPIFPTSNGKVVGANWSGWGYGNHVLIQHNSQAESLYAHLSKILVKPGQKVTKETKIGEVGATGWATGNHLHFELYQNGTPVNPLEVLPEITQ